MATTLAPKKGINPLNIIRRGTSLATPAKTMHIVLPTVNYKALQCTLDDRFY